MSLRLLIVLSLVVGLISLDYPLRADEPVEPTKPLAPKPADEGKEKPVEPVKPPQPQPVKPPDDKPAEPQKPAPKPEKTEPSKAPTTQPSKFPSARETMEKLLSLKKRDTELLQVAYIDLDMPLTEKPAEFSLFGGDSLTLHSVIDRLNQARQQKDVRGVLINMGATGFNMAQAQELRDALASLRKAGKRTFVYADAFDTASYIAASGATDICMLEGGEIMIPGVGLETMFAKALLDKVGVKADYVQIGQYKGADEQYTRTEASPQMRGELNKLIDALFEQIVDGIAYNRNLPRAQVEDMINGVMLPGRIAKDRGFIDHLVDQDGLRALLKEELGRDINLMHDYGKPERQAIDWSNPFALLSSLSKKEPESEKPAIAVIYAEGVIIDGEGGEDLLGGSSVGSENIRKALRVASRDEKVQAIVLRIDSPGGSAMASEVMWQAARRAAEEKPLIISIGSMAASGGYYLACAGEHIFADPSAIVGSIGVVGGKFVMQDLFGKIGVNTESFIRGKNADLFSSNQPFTDQQRRLITNWMKQTYEQFTDRVMTTRKDRIKDIDEVAHGRVFLAKQAKDLGMVDTIGGLDAALAYAAEQAEVKDGEYEIKVLPRTRTIADYLRGDVEDARMPIAPKVQIPELSIFNALSPASARLLRQQLQVLHCLQQRPVMLVSPYVVTLR